MENVPLSPSTGYQRPGESFVDMIIADKRLRRSWTDKLIDLDDGKVSKHNGMVQSNAPAYRPDSAHSSVTAVNDFTRQAPSSTCDCDAAQPDPQVIDSSDNSALHKWYTKWVKDWWALEVGSMLLGTICVIAIAIMLLEVNGREMPRWHLGVTIDAVLSVLSGFSKSCLLMPTAEALGQLKWTLGKRHSRRAIDVERIDKASRGTWGSVALLVRNRGITLTSLGAAIVLLSLPLDLCFQQIVRYPVERVRDVSATATIARAIDYAPPEDRQWRGPQGWTIQEDNQLIAFLYSSWTAKARPGPGIKFNCPSGNCTFSPFHTIGMDFECSPLPQDLLVRDCRDASNDWLTYVSSGIDENLNISTCGYYLNVPGSYPRLMSGYQVIDNDTIGETLATRFLELSDIWTNQQYFNGSIRFRNTSDRIINFIHSSTPDSFEGVMNGYAPILHECEIHWALKEIQAEVSNGQLTERAINTLAFSNDTGPYWHPDDVNWYLLNPQLTLPDVHSSTGSTLYRVDNTTARKVWQAFAQIAPSTYVKPNSTAEYPPMLKAVWLAARPSAPRLLEVLQPILPWDTPNNISAHLEKTVRMMNEVIRTNVLSRIDPERDYVKGEVWRNAVLVRVNWAWFAFPATLWCVAVVFLTATIWRSSKTEDKSAAYKTSLLPMLLNEKSGTAHDICTVRKMGSMRKQAKVSTLRIAQIRDG